MHRDERVRGRGSRMAEGFDEMKKFLKEGKNGRNRREEAVGGGDELVFTRPGVGSLLNIVCQFIINVIFSLSSVQVVFYKN